MVVTVRLFGGGPGLAAVRLCGCYMILLDYTRLVYYNIVYYTVLYYSSLLYITRCGCIPNEWLSRHSPFAPEGRPEQPRPGHVRQPRRRGTIIIIISSSSSSSSTIIIIIIISSSSSSIIIIIINSIIIIIIRPPWAPASPSGRPSEYHIAINNNSY